MPPVVIYWIKKSILSCQFKKYKKKLCQDLIKRYKLETFENLEELDRLRKNDFEKFYQAIKKAFPRKIEKLEAQLSLNSIGEGVREINRKKLKKSNQLFNELSEEFSGISMNSSLSDCFNSIFSGRKETFGRRTDRKDKSHD